MNPPTIITPRKLTRQEAFLINKKLKAHLPNEITGCQKMFAAVIEHAVQDLGSKSVKERRQAWRFLMGENGGIKTVGALAEIDPDYIKRVLEAFSEMLFSEESEAA